MKPILVLPLALACAFGVSPAAAGGQFIGSVVLTPAGCESLDECMLGQDFGYLDKRGVGWQAKKDDKTDGASIPKWAQMFAGDPWTPDYLKAAVLHDHYSKSVRPVRGWYETQRMFYEALLDSGVSTKKAAMLFSGVLIGSGKWIVKMKGRKCPIGDVCVTNVVELSTETENPSFGEPDYEASLKRLQAAIDAAGELDEDAIRALALDERPDSQYLKHPGGIIKVDLEQWPFATPEQ